MESVWFKDIERPRFDRLENDIKTDVLVIGGGMAGLLCAHMLTRAGVDCVVAEADRICGGVTGNTTAKITVQHGLIYSSLIRTYGADAAKMYLSAQKDALENYRRLCRDTDCDFEQKASFVYSRADRRRIEDEARALKALGCDAELVKTLPFPFKTEGAVKVDGQAQFHPLKFAYSIARNLKIYENTRVTELRPDYAVTDRAKIRAKRIVVATHFPFINKHGCYYLKMYQHRSYVIALKNGPELGGMYVDEDKKGMSFRNCKDMLFIGGGSHRTGKKGGDWRELESFAKAAYPTSEEVCRWATQDCMTPDGAPYIGQYSARTRDLYVATGFNKWGMTGAMTAATLLTDMLTGKKNRYQQVFSPSRSILHPQLAVNAAETAINLLTPTAPRCPHMGCALKYNKTEHSWDCPCHGSRFTKSGKLLDNPATGDLR